MTTPVAVISATGIAAPTYDVVYAWVQAQFQVIYGSDVVVEPSSQDGQWLAIIAQAILDCNSMAVATYNAFSPSTAQGTGLSSVVKINGIERNVATNSSVSLLLGGVSGTVLMGAYATDTNGNQWDIPNGTTIPSSGQLYVTATAADVGAITADAGTITTIGTPTAGWSSVTNPSAATAGAPVETDAALRQRQTISTALPSATIVQGIEGAIAALAGVTVVKIYENDTGGTDANGIPGHTIAAVVEGGDNVAIATVIANKKAPGCGTYGNTPEVIVDSVSGIPKTISFWRATDVQIDVVVNLTALQGYSSNVGALIQAALVAYSANYTPGDDVYVSRLYSPANLSGPNGNTYKINSIQICVHLGTPAAADVPISFVQRAVISAANVYLNVASS